MAHFSRIERELAALPIVESVEAAKKAPDQDNPNAKEPELHETLKTDGDKTAMWNNPEEMATAQANRRAEALANKVSEADTKQSEALNSTEKSGSMEQAVSQAREAGITPIQANDDSPKPPG